MPEPALNPEVVARHREEIERGERFSFGQNWAAFLRLMDEDRITTASAALTGMLGRQDLTGLRFLDIGSGSGLTSLAARRLGADVVSFDYDPDSVTCTAELRRRYCPDDAQWRIEQGSALDEPYLRSLGTFDVVYSWGVLHHSGEMWRALELVSGLVSPKGQLFLAIYNDQGAWSRRWGKIKRLYCSGRLGRLLVLGIYVPGSILRNLLADLAWGRDPAARYRDYRQTRGMSIVHDWVDWLGGYPFEYAKPEQVFDFYRQRGFELQRLVTAGGSVGCNEFVFVRR